MGEFRYDALGKVAHDNVFIDGSWAVINNVKIVDASGQEIPASPAADIEAPAPTRPDAETWNYQVEKNFVPPLTIHDDVEVIRPVGAPEQAEFEFDAGPHPQDGDEWSVNQDFKLGGYSLHLVSIRYSSNFGYEFHFTAQHGASANAIRVELPGYTPNCGGGGGGDDFPDEFSVDFCITPAVGAANFPKGKLTALLSFQALTRAHQAYQIQWSPDSTQARPFATPTPESGVCLTRSNLSQLAPLPSALTGKVLLSESLNNGQTWSLILVNLDGSQPQGLTVPHGRGGALSPDGKQLAYSGYGNMAILDLATGKSVALKGTPETYGSWSPDGKQIAYVTRGDAYGIFVVAIDGSGQRQLSNLGYEAIAGWSPDGKKLYYAIPGLNLKEVDVASGQSHDLFELQGASAKDPRPAVSPDGNWIAYQGEDGLYVMRMDGTQGHLLIDVRSMGYGISGFAWGLTQGWLAASLSGSQEPDSQILLLRPDTCEAYRLPALHGELEGLAIP